MLKNVWNFYYNGFRHLSPLGRTLWLLILIKLAVMFLVLRMFLFRPALSGMSEQEKEQYVASQLIDTKISP